MALAGTEIGGVSAYFYLCLDFGNASPDTVSFMLTSKGHPRVYAKDSHCLQTADPRTHGHTALFGYIPN